MWSCLCQGASWELVGDTSFLCGGFDYDYEFIAHFPRGVGERSEGVAACRSSE